MSYCLFIKFVELNYSSYLLIITYMFVVIPGGGGGSDGYPPWTRSRTEAAFDYYKKLDFKHPSTVAFVTLSAGSMNVSKE